MYYINDFGAEGDGKTLNTQAIQTALNACSSAGGGRVVVPPGCFVTGTLWMRDHVELHLEAGAILLASPNMEDYNGLDAYEQNFAPVNDPYEDWTGAHLILGIEVEDVAITGPGTIDGNAGVFYGDPVPFNPGSFTWRDGLATARDRKVGRPGQMIVFCESRDIRIRDLALRNATCWACYVYGCEDVFIRGVKVNNKPYHCNTDGIDIDSSRNVTISDCIIDSGDDAITLRGNPSLLKNKNRISENIVVTNCVVGSSSSVFRIGVGDGVIRDVVFSNIIITRGGTGIDFNSAYTSNEKGVTFRNIRFRDVSMRNVAFPFRISGGPDGATSEIENIVFDGLTVEAFAPIYISGNKNNPARNITLRNMEITVVPNPVGLESPDKYPCTLFQLGRVDGMTMDRVCVHWLTSGPNWRQTLQADEVANLDIAGNCLLPEPETDTHKAGAGDS